MQLYSCCVIVLYSKKIDWFSVGALHFSFWNNISFFVVETDASSQPEFTDCSRYLALTFFFHCETSRNIFTLCLAKSWTENNSYFIIFLWCFFRNKGSWFIFIVFQSSLLDALATCLFVRPTFNENCGLLNWLWPNYTLTHIHSSSLRVRNNVW